MAVVETTGNEAVDLGPLSEDEIVALTDIDGIVAEGSRRTLASRALTRREGAILPLLSADDPAERFCVEKTVTINTTAAGGNATLLAKI